MRPGLPLANVPAPVVAQRLRHKVPVLMSRYAYVLRSRQPVAAETLNSLCGGCPAKSLALVLAALLACCSTGCGDPTPDPFEGEYVGLRGPQVQLRIIGMVTISVVSPGRYDLTAVPALPCSPITLQRASDDTLVPAAGQCAASGTLTLAGDRLSISLDAIAFQGIRR